MVIKMPFNVEMHTDIGIRKATNQDSIAYKEAQTDKGTILFAIICDGMGGLAKGELASATIIRAFSEWFENELPAQLSCENITDEVRYHWDRLIKKLNQDIAEYGRQNRIQLGSTITAMLFLENGTYLIAHVGDSRAYKITNNNIEILTEDQTVVAREIKMGRLTAEQAEKDPRRNVLLQCVGASKIVEPVYIRGSYSRGEEYMLCSDGFRHVISANEIHQAFAPNHNNDEKTMKYNIVRMIELIKQRHETDNISSILIKVI
jgi:serine/threonine protein phosphatase PrpC